ncbi:hypothetical protein, partial [Bacillus paranthracis]|uniref:hypothetical protein n=1 Tax=Bacillus paranthracis TaxID=2026186 RepID=UPI002D77774C
KELITLEKPKYLSIQLRNLGFNIGMFKEIQQSYHQFNILRCSQSENLLAFTLFIRFQLIFYVLSYIIND